MMEVYLSFLGCKVNDYEVEALKASFLKLGHKVVEDVKEAKLIIVNTCDVTEVAKNKSLKTLRSLHKLNPEAKCVAMGCIVEDLKEEIFTKLPFLSAAIGTRGRKEVLKIAQSAPLEPRLVLNDKTSRTYEELGHIASFKGHVRAYVKSSDGCDKFCTYCIIPYVRGRMHIRKREDIILEIGELLNHGIKEIVLTGIDTVAYLDELGDLVSLLKDILATYPNLYRLRLSSVELSTLSDEFIALLKNDRRLCRYLHLSLQSGCDRILKLMHRHYDKEAFLKRVKKVKEEVSDVSFATDIIVGFPSESDEEFIETLNFIKEVNFFKVHVFPYSERNGTYAQKFLKDDVSKEKKKERVHALLDVERSLRENILSKMLGKEVEILIESKDNKNDIYYGMSDNYIMLGVKDAHIGDIVKTKITQKDIDFNVKVRF